MRFSLVPAVGALLFGATLVTAAPTNDAAAILQDLQRQAEAKLREADKLAPRARPGHGGQTCTLANAAVRKDWYIIPPFSFFTRHLPPSEDEMSCCCCPWHTDILALFLPCLGSICPDARKRTTSGQYNACGNYRPSIRNSPPRRTTSTTLLPCT
jgi:hypothetical protein